MMVVISWFNGIAMYVVLMFKQRSFDVMDVKWTLF